MNFFKKISSKRISTAPDECDNRKFKTKYIENKPLSPSPPLLSKAFSKDDSLLELNIPDDFSSFDIPQLQSVHIQSVDLDSSLEYATTIVQETRTITNITAVDNATICLEPFSKTETEQGTRMHAEVNNSNASTVHATISENHSELALEFTENQTSSCPYSPTQEEGEDGASPLFRESTEAAEAEATEPDSIESRNGSNADNSLSIDSSIISSTPFFTSNLNTSDVGLSSGKEIEDAPILSIETNQALLEVDKEGTDLDSANDSDSRSSHQSFSLSQEIAKFSTPSRRNSNCDAVIIETPADQNNEQEPPALLQTRSSSEDNISETIIENEQAVNSLSITSSLDDQEPQTLDNSIASTENDICVPNNTSMDMNQTNSSATSRAVKRRSVHSLIPRKQQQQAVFEEPTTNSKLPVQINKIRQVVNSGIPLPSRLSTIIPSAIIQETLTAISSPSSSSGSLGKSVRSLSSASTSSSSDNSHHSQQQQRKGTGGRSPVHNYRPLIQPQSKIPIATVNPPAEIEKLAEAIPASNHISRLPKRNSTIV